MEPIYLHHVEETAKASEAGGPTSRVRLSTLRASRRR